MIVWFVVGGGISVLVWVAIRMTRNRDTSYRLDSVAFVAKVSEIVGPVIIDVRTPGEFLTGHMKGAKNIDVQGSGFMAAIKKLDSAKTYFVYCRSGMRSAVAVSHMRQAGLMNIYELAGGTSAAPQLMTER